MSEEVKTKKKNEAAKPDVEMTVVEHLGELRKRVIISAIFVVVALGASFFFIKDIMGFVKGPMEGSQLIFIAPSEMFMTNLKLAFFTGLFVALPVVLYQIWAFVAVGLLSNERRYILIGLPISVILFLGGSAFCFFLLLPIALKFLLGFASEGIQPMLSISKYVSFVGFMLIGVGLIFEMPLVILVLNRIGILPYRTLSRSRQYAFLIILVVGAIITPSTDIFTLGLLAVPIYALYEISVWLARLAERRRRDAEMEGDLQ